MLAYKDGDRVRLVSRNGRDHTRRFADLAAAIAKLFARTLVLDGELAVFDQQLRSRSTGGASRTLLRSPRLRSSSPSISCIATAETSPGCRCPRGGSTWRTSSPAPTSCCLSGAWPRTASTPGPGCRERVRGPGREGRGQRVRGRGDETVAEGEAEGLDGRRRRVAASVRHSLIAARARPDVAVGSRR
jgi:hypothetical protein